MGPAAHKIIDQAIVRLFQKLRERTLGNYATGKTLELTLRGIFDAAAAEEGSKPSSDTLASLLKVSSSYIDAAEAKTRAKLAQAVQAHLQEAKLKGVQTDFRTVLAGKLEEALGEAQNDVKRILQTESTIVRNVSLADGISKANAAVGIEDPTVFFVTVNDSSRCAECTRLHVQPDGVTPRVWKMSELGTGYHKRGDSTPKVGGLHPHCLTGGMRIHTDRGVLTAKELFEAGTDLTVVVDARVRARRVGGNQFGAEIPGESWFNRHASGSVNRPATHVYDTGVQECYLIELDSGHALEVSGGHEMWVDDGRSGHKVRADQLSVGDKVPLLSGAGLFGADRFPELAELMGNLMGDGCIGDTATWIFFGDDLEYGQKLRKLAEPYCEFRGHMRILPPDDKYTVARATFNSTRLARVFTEEFGLSKQPRRVPPRIWGADRDTVSAFLRGLFAADGHVEKTPGVVLAQNDLKFLREVQCLLANFGIVSRIYSHGESTAKTITYANGDVHETMRKPCWRLHVGGWQQTQTFADIIGMGVPAKQQRLQRALSETEDDARLGNWRTAKIRSMKPIGLQQTYCLTEPMTNTITVNGVVTGQCRCVLTTLMPGYGFNAAGRVTYKAPGYSEYEAQRGTETLQKSTKRGLTVTFNPLREHLKALRADREAEWAKNQEENTFHYPIPHENVESLIANAPVSINFPFSRVNDFLKEGRLKNLFETGHGMGSTDKEMRAAHENALFNIPNDAPSAVRPIYGALNLLHTHNRALDHFGPAPAYGEAWLVLKPHVKNRTTVTPSDSFNHDIDDVELADHPYLIASRHVRRRRQSEPLMGLEIAMNDHRFEPDLLGEGIPYHNIGQYIEAQVHGGVRMKDDVAEIHFRPMPNTNVSTMKELVDHHQRIRKAAEDFSRKFKVPAFIHHHDFDPKNFKTNSRTGKQYSCDPEESPGGCDPSHWRVEEVRAWEKQPEADLKKSTFHGMKSLHNMQERLHSNKKMYEGPTDFGVLEPYRERFLAAPVTVNLPARALFGLIESGRLKNQFETGTTLGSSCLRTRKGVERNVFDIPEEAQDGERPVYGAIHLHHDDPTLKRIGGASEYGNLWLKLKPHVHERTTVTKGDSFDETPAYAFEDRALPLMKRLGNPCASPALIGHLTGKSPLSVNWGYTEAQIHGGVGLAEDVDELHIGPFEYRGFPAQEKEVESLATALGKKYGVRVIAHRREKYNDSNVKEVVLHDPNAPTSTPETSPIPPESEKSSGQE